MKFQASDYFLTIFYESTARLMSDLVGNITCRFSHVNAYFTYQEKVIVTVWVCLNGQSGKCEHDHIPRGHCYGPDTVTVMWILPRIARAREFSVVTAS